MTSDENPADVIEQAAEAAYKTGIYVNEYAAGQIARALADAGLLADPADRDEPYDQLDNQRNLWAKQCHEAESRAERAEAEVARLNAEMDRLAGLRDRVDELVHYSQRAQEAERKLSLAESGFYAERKAVEQAEAEVAELRATVDRVRGLADEWESEGINCACGHDVGGSHNSNGCYAAVSYFPDVVRCGCSETDAQMDHEIAVVSLRAALDGEGEQ